MADPTYPASFFANLFDVSERHIRAMAREGMIPKIARGKYPLMGTIRSYVGELRRQVEGSQEFTDLRKEQARKARAQAEMLEMELAIQRKEHIHVSHVQELLRRFAEQASAIFQAAPSRIKNRLPHLKSRDINIIKKELAGVSTVMVELSKMEVGKPTLVISFCD